MEPRREAAGQGVPMRVSELGNAGTVRGAPYDEGVAAEARAARERVAL